ncbi:hypothetical protein [Halolamina sp. C58]|uniref:hypothetical protein n=1 Tax=Halolamina sp. C58 TaxID=3421640 RepID=UPI003EBDE6C1
MDRDTAVRVVLGLLIVLGGAGIIVATATGRDAYLSAGAAVVCLLSAAAMAYTNHAGEP